MKILMSGNKGPIRQEDIPMVQLLEEKYPDIEFVRAGALDEQVNQISGCEIFYGWPTRDIYLAGKNLKWVHCPGTGVDQLTKIPELVCSQIVVTNAKGPHASPMADHTLGMIISLAHRLHEQRDDQRDKIWDSDKYLDTFEELAGSTMGILSFGDIGAAIAKRASGFDMDVYAVDLHPKPSHSAVNEIWGLDRLEELMSISDWFVVTSPVTENTIGMIDRHKLSILKTGSRIIIISRGGIVDEEALAQKLISGHLGGAGIDAFALEPLPHSSPLWNLPNVIVTPHSSAHTSEMTEGRRQIFVENLERYLSDEPFLYVVDKQAGF